MSQANENERALEPEARQATVDHSPRAVDASAAISLKRIADALVELTKLFREN